MYLIFDTETTGLPKNWRAPISDTENWPRCVQLAWQVHDEIGNLIESKSYIIKQDNFDIPYESCKLHTFKRRKHVACQIYLDFLEKGVYILKYFFEGVNYYKRIIKN